MRIIAIIPARMGSSRFPGKPLAKILGCPMIEHVYRRTVACKLLESVYVATCDKVIYDALESIGANVLMTSDKHQRASDRVEEAARNLEADIVVMVQGDEPMIVPQMIEQALEPLINDPSVVCVNLAKLINTIEEFKDRNTIKVVMDNEMNALYFSREAIPTTAVKNFGNIPAYKQVCAIPFRKAFLVRYASLGSTPLETVESVDMLRILEHGYKVRVVQTEFVTYAVDTQGDLERVEKLMSSFSDEQE